MTWQKNLQFLKILKSVINKVETNLGTLNLNCTVKVLYSEKIFNEITPLFHRPARIAASISKMGETF